MPTRRDDPGFEIDRLTAVRGELAVGHPSGKLTCTACGHRCTLAVGKRGICRLRYRDQDGLRVPWGYTAGAAVDPIEKKPLFHVCPGSSALSFGMIGCDFHCAFCQNWVSAQALRDGTRLPGVRETSPEQLVAAALRSSCRSLVSTYNEPLISAEWARDIFAVAQAEGLLTAMVSNGHGTPEVLDLLRPVTDAIKVDLKAFRERTYRELGGRLEVVTETIRGIHQRGMWTEIVTLVVPGLNDDPGELADIAGFIASVAPSIPWHVTAFHPDYKMTDRGRTPAQTLARAREIGIEAGLHFVYAGNLPGRVQRAEDTFCPGCGRVVVERIGYMVTRNHLGDDGACSFCGTQLPGLWR